MSGWREHRGGACPTDPMCEVRVRFRGFETPFESKQTYLARQLFWGRRDNPTDIIAFLVVSVPEDLAA